MLGHNRNSAPVLQSNILPLADALLQGLSSSDLDRCDAFKVGSQLCCTLKRAHRAGWLNRDVRPCNIVLATSWPTAEGATRGPAPAASQAAVDEGGAATSHQQWQPPPWPNAASSSPSLPQSAFLIDWGTAINVSDGPKLYEGGLRYASTRLLRHFSGHGYPLGGQQQGGHLLEGGQLQGGQLQGGGQEHADQEPGGQVQGGVPDAAPFRCPVPYHASDDLVSLVRSLFVLRHPCFKQQLEGSPSEDFAGIAREALQLWDTWLGEASGRSGWRAAEAKAEACDYEGVGEALDALLE